MLLCWWYEGSSGKMQEYIARVCYYIELPPVTVRDSKATVQTTIARRVDLVVM